MRRFHGLAAIAVAILLSPISAWWLVGDFSMAEPASQPDYMFQPLDLAKTEELVLGTAAMAATVVAAALVVGAVRRRLVTVAELLVALPLLIAGAFCGFAWRVMTAAVIGANIGGGMILLFAPFFLASMLGWSALQWRKPRSMNAQP